jgi:molybdate transport system substrate-binding protein
MVRKILLATLGVFLFTSCGDKNSLDILTAAGLKEPFQHIVEKYRKEHPEVSLNVVYAGSGSLLVKLQKGFGDLYIPAAVSYMYTAERNKLIDPETVKVVAYHEPVLVVRKGIPINSVEDLIKLKGIKIGISDPREAAIGKITYEILKAMGLWKSISKKVVVKTPTVNQLVLYLKEGQIDAAVIWKELALKLKGFKIVEFPEKFKRLEAIPVGVSTFAKNRKLAVEFENFLLRHREVFKNYGFLIKETEEKRSTKPTF